MSLVHDTYAFVVEKIPKKQNTYIPKNLEKAMVTYLFEGLKHQLVRLR